MQNKNLKKELEALIPANTLKALYLCSEAAGKLSLNIYLIGGAVRDIILGKNHFDTDITVHGNAVDFARFLEKTFPKNCKVKEIHDAFKTAKVFFCINEDNVEIDLASTRKESYPYPASLPFVEEIGCNLYEDVIRRDFSINSMSLSINRENFGDLIDYLNGYEDLQNRKIKILNNKSFIDDPTRIIRALKFRVRFDCKLDKKTKILQDECLDSGRFDNLCGERIKSELKQTFNLNSQQALQIFMRENIYRLLEKDLCTNIPVIEEIINCYLVFINTDFAWLIYVGIMLTDLSAEKIKQKAECLYLTNPETEILTEAKKLLEKEVYIDTPFSIYEFFEDFPIESIIIFLIKNPKQVENVELYLKKLKDINIFTTGKDLIEMGLAPGESFGKILREVLKAKINGEFSTREEESNFLKNIISNS